MANWCSNTVTFKGNEESADKILQLFKTMMEQEKKSGEGQIPDFVQNKDGYFFEIYQNETDECSFQYETKWCPNIEVLYQISDHYNAEFGLEYAELGSCIYGRTTYQNQVLDDICLDFSDFDKYCYDEETDTYQFEEETYDSDLEILEILLKRKIKKETDTKKL
ncbi:MAG: hypothetical protein J6O88_18900 [Chryseobacterium sp.]|uniref:DUF1281 family ferredoxin-like fold protein n=1 Tax=Chryseobacterium sp. TaxID=1871047 RepID=UPI001B0A4D1A|nr:hypothetical protein [Chryseobacterium sp.]MBO6186725.1 hypothetical protein [Chryseobacterium sp.]